MFSDLKWRTFTIRMKASAEISVPTYSGSMLRGAFGHALKRVLCTVYHGNCGACHRVADCHYFQIFETDNPALRSQGLQFMPHPFVLVPPIGPAQLPEGAELEWKITIFGSALEKARYLMIALRSMAEMGLGAKRIPFELVSIVSEGLSVYDLEADVFSIPEGLSLQQFVQKRVADFPERLGLSFETPVRLSRKGKDLYFLTSEVFVDAIIRRFRLMVDLYGKFDERDIADVTCNIEKVSESSIYAPRYSNRQGKKTGLKGICGDYTLLGCSETMRTLLAAAEVLHIGKNTAFGFGQPKIHLAEGKDIR